MRVNGGRACTSTAIAVWLAVGCGGGGSDEAKECPIGQVDCPCTPSGTCEPGLACMDGTCFDPGGGGMPTGDDGDGGDDAGSGSGGGGSSMTLDTGGTGGSGTGGTTGASSSTGGVGPTTSGGTSDDGGATSGTTTSTVDTTGASSSTSPDETTSSAATSSAGTSSSGDTTTAPADCVGSYTVIPTLEVGGEVPTSRRFTVHDGVLWLVYERPSDTTYIDVARWDATNGWFTYESGAAFEVTTYQREWRFLHVRGTRVSAFLTQGLGRSARAVLDLAAPTWTYSDPFPGWADDADPEHADMGRVIHDDWVDHYCRWNSQVCYTYNWQRVTWLWNDTPGMVAQPPTSPPLGSRGGSDCRSANVDGLSFFAGGFRVQGNCSNRTDFYDAAFYDRFAGTWTTPVELPMAEHVSEGTEHVLAVGDEAWWFRGTTGGKLFRLRAAETAFRETPFPAEVAALMSTSTDLAQTPTGAYILNSAATSAVVWDPDVGHEVVCPSPVSLSPRFVGSSAGEIFIFGSDDPTSDGVHITW